ncbi:MAG: MFS transporter [Chloroflexota bacterium]
MDRTVRAANPLHTIKIPSFRWLTIGHTASSLGDQFYLIALPWLALQLTGSGVALGSVLAVAAVPRALFMIFGGALADRFSPKIVLFISSVASAGINALFAALILTDSVQTWHLYVFAVALGLVDAIAFPAADALVPKLVQKTQLNAANALIGLVTQVTTFLGPGLAGLVIAQFSIGAAFVGSVIASLLAIVGISQIRYQYIPTTVTTFGVQEALNDIREGFVYTWNNKALRVVIGLIAAINLLLVGPILVGGGILANTRFGGADAFGWMVSAWGAGGLIGAIAAGTITIRRVGWILLAASAMMGLSLIAFGFAPTLLLVLLVVVTMGFANGWMEVYATTWLQVQAGPSMQGRVMGITAVAALGLEPVSYALTGVLAELGLTTLFLCAGGVLLITTALAAASRSLRNARSD